MDIFLLLGILILGTLLGWFFRRISILVAANQYMLRISLWILLAAMGAKLAQHRALFTGDIKIIFTAIGSSAALTAVFFIFFWLAKSINIRRKNGRMAHGSQQATSEEKSGTGLGIHELLSVATNGGCIIAGFLLLLLMPDTLSGMFSVDKLTNWLLRALLFCIGFDLGLELHRLDLRLLTPKLLLVPLINIAMSLTIGLIFGSLSGLGARDGSLLTAGMGWYSLSSVLLADRGMILLSLLTFIHNVFRELFAIICAPLAAKVSPMLPVYLGGATSMDVMLPFVQRYSGKEYTLVSFYSGVVCSGAVLPLVNLIAGMGG